MAKSLISRLVQIGYERSRFKAGPDMYTRVDVYKMLKKPAIWDSLPEAARAYLTYLPDKAIPRDVIAILDRELAMHVHGLRLKVAGSYRRGKTMSNDADIVIINRGNPIEKIQNGIAKSRTIKMIPPYALGPDRASVFFEIKTGNRKYVVKSDIFIAEPDEYNYMLLYATGSGGFNIIMRAQAKRRGLLLNQRGLYNRDGKSIGAGLSEREIFERVGMSYRDPTEREIALPKKAKK